MSTNTNDKFTEYHMTRGVYTSNGWQSRDTVTTGSTGFPCAMVVCLVFVVAIIAVVVINAIH